MASNIGSITFDVVLRMKDGSAEHVVGELEIPISIDLTKSGTTMRLMNTSDGVAVGGNGIMPCSAGGTR